MAYVYSTWTANTPVDAGTLETALKDLRLYVNRGIRSVDFSADVVTTEDILEGDPVGATRADFHAASGDVYSQHADSARVNRQYLTGTVTSEADYSSGYALRQELPGCSKQIVVEREALVITTVWMMVIAGESNLSLNTIDPVSSVFMFVDETAIGNVSISYVFVEDPAVAATEGGPQPAGSAMNRRPYSFTHSTTLPAGSHTIIFKADLHSEKMFISARNMTIEVLYL